MESAIPRDISLVLDEDGRFIPEADGRDEYNFGLHLAAEDPYQIQRILDFDSSVLQGVDADDLKVAPSSTLTHFLLHGEEDAYREGLAACVLFVLEGQHSSSKFKRSMRIRRPEGLTAQSRAGPLNSASRRGTDPYARR